MTSQALTSILGWHLVHSVDFDTANEKRLYSKASYSPSLRQMIFL